MIDIKNDIASEWNAEMVVDEQRGFVERLVSVPPELTGMTPAFNFFLSSQTLLKKGWRLEGNKVIFPLKIGAFHGPPIPSLRFLIVREVRIHGDTIKYVEEGIGGAKSLLKLMHANTSDVSVEILKSGSDEVHRYTSYYPVLNRVVIGIDDTDTSIKGDTYLTALQIGRSIESEGYGRYVKQSVTINYPLNPFKTTNNASSAMVFHVKPVRKAKLISAVVDKVQEQSNSRETGLAVLEGLEIPAALKRYTKRCKAKMLQVSDTEQVAETIGARLVSFDRDRGKIGALSSIGYVDNPYLAMSPSLRFRTLMKLGNLYVKIRDSLTRRSSLLEG